MMLHGEMTYLADIAYSYGGVLKIIQSFKCLGFHKIDLWLFAIKWLFYVYCILYIYTVYVLCMYTIMRCFHCSGIMIFIAKPELPIVLCQLAQHMLL